MNALQYIAGKLFSNDKLVSTIGATAEDGGIESGSNANGNYTKFPDGTMIATYTTTTTYVTTNGIGSGGVLFYTDTPTGLDWSTQGFIALPAVILTPVSVIKACWLSVSTNPSATLTGKIRVFSYNNDSSCRVQYTMIGRWK